MSKAFFDFLVKGRFFVGFICKTGINYYQIERK